MIRGAARRSVRIDDPLWERAKEVADDRGDDLSTIIRIALINYISESESE